MSDELNLDGMNSSNRRDINRFKVTEGSHVYRILPPFGTNHKNVPSRKVELHWGFFKKDGKPSPVPCSYATEGYCPICDKVKQMEALANRSKANGNEEECKAILEDASKIKSKRSFLLNAANKNGEVGILELTKTAIDQLVELMKQYQNKYGKNPVGLATGVWFVFSRSGKGFNTKYGVEFHKTIITLPDGDQVEKLDNSALAPNIVENFDKLAYDIHKMYAPVSSGDLAKILAGSPVDEVIVKKSKEDSEDEAPAAAPAAKAAPAAVAKPAPAPKAAPAPAPAEDVDDIMSILND